ncbi:Uncharacterised protein [Eubacterium limosum]|uniref:Uncharacterized protein n=1 Tax=Eubacterium limosum TaxID=1736 RepID=A0A6N3FDJ0_EUBLI
MSEEEFRKKAAEWGYTEEEIDDIITAFHKEPPFMKYEDIPILYRCVRQYGPDPDLKEWV